jgi:hypothetical protein
MLRVGDTALDQHHSRQRRIFNGEIIGDNSRWLQFRRDLRKALGDYELGLLDCSVGVEF